MRRKEYVGVTGFTFGLSLMLAGLAIEQQSADKQAADEPQQITCPDPETMYELQACLYDQEPSDDGLMTFALFVGGVAVLGASTFQINRSINQQSQTAEVAS